MSQSSMSPASSGAGQADPSTGEDDGSGQQQFQIVIAVDAQGNITVGTDAGDDSGDGSSGQSQGSMSADGSSDSDSSGDMQPVKSIKEALTIALDIYRNAGQMTDSDADFNSGYAGQSSSQAAGPSTYAGNQGDDQ